MKINDIKIPELSELKRPEKPVKKEPSASAPDSRDMVAISPEALEMQEAIETARAAPDIRIEKVRHLKEEIERGMYRVRGSNVAEKMLESVFEK